MSKKIMYIIVVSGLCFGQNPDLEPMSYENSFNKTTSLELFAGVHLTFAHEMVFLGMMLPEYMMQGGVRIAHQSSRHIVWSVAGSYSRANDLDSRLLPTLPPPVLDFVYLDADLNVSYARNITGRIGYLIGAGFDISHLRVVYNETTTSNADETFSSTYLRPMIGAALKFNIIPCLFLQMHARCCFYHLIQTGEEYIQLDDISPSMSLGIGYTFVHVRR